MLTQKQKYAVVVAIVAIVLLIIVMSMKMRKEGLAYKTPTKQEKFAPSYQLRPYVKEGFSNDFVVPLVAKAQKSATRVNPFVGSL